jgi:mannose-6-phosphate isomerase-like protein (cupin superfamily)
MKIKLLLATLIIGFFISFTVNARQNGTPLFGRTDQSKFTEAKKGAGTILYQNLLGQGSYGTTPFESPFLLVRAGVIQPKSSISEHIHRDMEEMYFVFGSPAEFTINGHTSFLPANSSVLCPLGSSHGVYNNSDKPVNWLAIGVSNVKGKGSAIDFGDSLTNKTPESPAPFRWTQFDRSLLKPLKGAHEGIGTILFRSVYGEDSFNTKWLRLGHMIIPPGSSLGYHSLTTIEIVYYVISGTGRMTVNDYTWDIKAGDAIPGFTGDSHGIYNNSKEDLEIFYTVVDTGKGENVVTNFPEYDLSKK